MGGFGSGNRRYGQLTRSTTGDMRSLDVRLLHRGGWLKPGAQSQTNWTRNGERVAWISLRASEAGVSLSYRQRRAGQEWQDMDYLVRVEWTPCALGGARPWWLCPAQGCGRRVAVLFGGDIFACRHCHRLAYASTREDAMSRAMGRADKLRERLGWMPGILNAEGGKPKGMHWRTYWRLYQSVIAETSAAYEHLDAAHDLLRGVEQKLMSRSAWRKP